MEGRQPGSRAAAGRFVGAPLRGSAASALSQGSLLLPAATHQVRLQDWTGFSSAGQVGDRGLVPASINRPGAPGGRTRALCAVTTCCPRRHASTRGRTATGVAPAAASSANPPKTATARNRWSSPSPRPAREASRVPSSAHCPRGGPRQQYTRQLRACQGTRNVSKAARSLH